MKTKDKFPVFDKHSDLIYLDSAASTLRPKVVIERMKEYASYEHANIHRGAYRLSQEATQRYEEVRAKVADFLGAKNSEIIFTYGATDGLNLLMRALDDRIQKGDFDSRRKRIVLSIYEHHSNLVPWQELAKRRGLELVYLYDFSETSLAKIDESTLLLSFTLMSNVSGRILPAKELITKAREVGAMILGDACQYISHHPLSVKEFDLDFLVFSGHKMFGPTGIGVLFGKEEELIKMPAMRFGGDMIEYVYEQSSQYLPFPQGFEAGTPNIEGVVGLGAAIDFINDYGRNKINLEVSGLREFALQELKKVEYVQVLEDGVFAGPVISFLVEGVHPHDVASILDHGNICIRAGHHCAQPLMRHLGIVGSNRISLQIYNEQSDLIYFIERLKEVRRWLGYGS